MALNHHDQPLEEEEKNPFIFSSFSKNEFLPSNICTTVKIFPDAARNIPIQTIEQKPIDQSLPPTQDMVTPIGMIYSSGGKTRSAKLTAVASDIIISYADREVKYELKVSK